MINVTKTYLPPFERYTALLKEVYDTGWITNNGKLVQRLEKELKEYLGVKHLFLCSNGTVTLQIALKALDFSGEVITTPFSYVATTNALLWEKCTPRFVDINRSDLCIDPELIEAAVNEKTTGILATHVFGFPCNIEAIQKIAEKHKLKVIYDAAHAFAAKYEGKSLLSYGDVSSCSFHATKIFHTVEGGCLVTNDDDIARKIYLYRQFGHVYDDYFSIGINAKNSEMHAAMGLAVLPDVEQIIERRKSLTDLYTRSLSDTTVEIVSYPKSVQPNYGYYPILLKNEVQLLKVKSGLATKDIFPRRYFFPSLNTLPFIGYQPCPVSENIASRVLCLPLYYDLTEGEVETICTIIKQCI
jgi:dTDP-4-amino-4,6-dideoxygalactose transaminase